MSTDELCFKTEGLPGSKLLAQLEPKEVALLRQALRSSVYHIPDGDDETDRGLCQPVVPEAKTRAGLSWAWRKRRPD